MARIGKSVRLPYLYRRLESVAAADTPMKLLYFHRKRALKCRRTYCLTCPTRPRVLQNVSAIGMPIALDSSPSKLNCLTLLHREFQGSGEGNNFAKFGNRWFPESAGVPGPAEPSIYERHRNAVCTRAPGKIESGSRTGVASHTT